MCPSRALLEISHQPSQGQRIVARSYALGRLLRRLVPRNCREDVLSENSRRHSVKLTLYAHVYTLQSPLGYCSKSTILTPCGLNIDRALGRLGRPLSVQDPDIAGLLSSYSVLLVLQVFSRKSC